MDAKCDNAKRCVRPSFCMEHDMQIAKDMMEIWGRRRSSRKITTEDCKRRDIQELIENIRKNDGCSVPVVLRIKNYVSSDINARVVDKILDALMENEHVEALYIQNFEEGMLDDQLEKLSKVLAKGYVS